jgi:sugar lactone lactonase YvrE
MILFKLKNSSALTIFAFISLFLFASCSKVRQDQRVAWTKAATLAGTNREFGEPFGLAVKDDVLYVSDGEQGKIWRVLKNGKVEAVTDKLNTPSGIAFDKQGFLIVADSGSHTIKSLNVSNGEISLVAGVENQKGYADSDIPGKALFNAPIGVAVDEHRIYVTDTYNDKIRVIEPKGIWSIGSTQGFSDGFGTNAKFDTPTGIAVLPDKGLVVADTGNKKIRHISFDGRVTTMAGTGDAESIDGLPTDSKFVFPTAVAADNFGAIYIADGNSIRALGRRFFPFVETITHTKRGFSDGDFSVSQFNRPSGLAIDEKGNLYVADSENQTVRVLTGGNLGAEISAEQIKKLRFTPEEFRGLQPPRWTYNPPEAARDVAGTLGEIRGEITEEKNAWFHNGLDIAGSYGETARFVRTEKVLRPLAVENVGGTRELLRMPTMGYIHIRLGRDQNDKLFNDERFEFAFDENKKIKNLRVPRGTKFQAGEAIGTLNSLNHVHLIAGRVGAEMNALNALIFPNISDTVAPKIEKLTLADENWLELEPEKSNQRFRLSGKTRIIARAFDQMNGNAGYRKLGVYKLGYQILREDKTPLADTKWTISFARYPDESAVRFVYARGSQSGYTPQTIFDYIVTNEVFDDVAREGFLDTGAFEAGNYILRVYAADFFGNVTEKDLNVEIVR